MQNKSAREKATSGLRAAVLIPGVTVFVSSACLMMVELIAGRFAVRKFGASLYTWTSVIGVTLAGLTIGNYIGGRIADRFKPKKALSAVFAISSICCVLAISMNNIAEAWKLLWYFSWPMRIFSHICIVFFPPSMLLGIISPVAAKMALEQSKTQGRTIGEIYAWGAAGSILGTFLAGFWLIGIFGSVALLWLVAGVLLAMGIAYGPKRPLVYVLAAFFFCLLFIEFAPIESVARLGSSMALREPADPNMLYEDESPYNYIAVNRVLQKPDLRIFVQDRLVHSKIAMGNITDLQYFYTKVYAALTEGLSREKDKENISALIIGGGGYVYPRYIKHQWPSARVDVVEIDPAVTEAAKKAFGLPEDTTIRTITADARNYVDALVHKINTGQEAVRYDFIYEDAVNNYSVPYQLVTKEFNDRITRILKDDGLYIVNLIDVYDSGLFLGAVTNTICLTFEHVYVFSDKKPNDWRNTFVIAASKHPIDVNRYIAEYGDLPDIRQLNNDEIAQLTAKSGALVLTDDYTPVENLLAPVAREDAVDFWLGECSKIAQRLMRAGRLDESVVMYKEAIKVRPTFEFYYQIAQISIVQGRLSEAEKALRKAIEIGRQTAIDMTTAYLDLGELYKQMGRESQAEENLRKAIEGFRRKLAKGHKSEDVIFGLGAALMEVGELEEAAALLRQTVEEKPQDAQKREMLARALLLQGRYDEAISFINQSIRYLVGQGLEDKVGELRKLAEKARAGKTGG